MNFLKNHLRGSLLGTIPFSRRKEDRRMGDGGKNGKGGMKKEVQRTGQEGMCGCDHWRLVPPANTEPEFSEALRSCLGNQETSGFCLQSEPNVLRLWSPVTTKDGPC